MYDQQNIFAKIIRGEIPADKIYEDGDILAFKDVAPAAPIHILVIPKGEYIDYADFANNASAEQVRNYFIKLSEIADSLDLEGGYRIVTNKGKDGGQTVFHFHSHIIGGKQMTGF